MTYLKQCPECDTKFPGDLHACTKCGNPEWACDPAPVNPLDYVYDIETYPNVFTCYVIHAASSKEWVFEISDRKNDFGLFCDFIFTLKKINACMIGWNNVGFDYPVIHYIITNNVTSSRLIYDKSMSIINGEKFGHVIWDNEQIIKQMDLYKIRHFDNMARATSLKSLEIAMRMDDIEDLPFPVGKILTSDEIDTLIKYNRHDVVSTVYFYVRTLEQIEFREELTRKYNRNFTNHNDTKIGKDYFIMELEKSGIQCFEKINGRKQPRQTIRPSIKLGDIIFPYVKFEHREFNRIKQFFTDTTITQIKGVFKDVTARIDNDSFVFGSGGLHMSVSSQTVSSDTDFVIVDVDVASYYPNLAIKNRIFPAHLGDVFCDIYEDVYVQRKSHAKGSAENAMLKLALNGVYGDSNNVYSPFYDSKYTMAITINGQLSLCMLVEQLIKVPGLKMVQCNTDGVTFLTPRKNLCHTRHLCKWWESITKLELEENLYSHMHIRDVNNYIAEYESGKVKRKGAYEYNLQWHQDTSAMVVAKAAEAALVHGEDIENFIRNHDDIYDFMLRAKVPRSNDLVMRFTEFNVDLPLASIVRYYISKTGGNLIKIAPPTGKTGTWKRKNSLGDKYYNDVLLSVTGTDFTNGDVDGVPHDERIHTKSKSKHSVSKETGISVGWKITDCSNVKNFNRDTLNYDYYIKEAKKLVEPLLTT